MINDMRTPLWTDAHPQLRTWYASELGQSIADELSLHLDTILPRIFGYQGLQVGSLTTTQTDEDTNVESVTELLHKAGIHRKILLDSPRLLECTDERHAADAGADAVSLPIANSVMKLVILPHTLDFCHRPHQALREADRVLSDDGQIVIIGFNPYSQFGLGNVLRRWRGKPPWNGHFFSRSRITDWLSVLNYQVLESRCFYLRPPINGRWAVYGLNRLEKLQPWFGAVGAVYLLHARKRTIPLTMVRAQRRIHRTGVPVTSFARTATSNRNLELARRSNRKPHE